MKNRFCVIGEKLTHSMSPQIHKRYFDYYKQDSTYVITQIPMEDMQDMEEAHFLVKMQQK